MTTIAEPRPVVTGGVDTHSDMHVTAVVTAVGGILGTAEFPTTVLRYRRLLAWVQGFGDLDRIGVEETGTYGVALARHLRGEKVTVVEDLGRVVHTPGRRHRTSPALGAAAGRGGRGRLRGREGRRPPGSVSSTPPAWPTAPEATVGRG